MKNSKNPKAADSGWKPPKSLSIPSGKQVVSLIKKHLKDSSSKPTAPKRFSKGKK